MGVYQEALKVWEKREQELRAQGLDEGLAPLLRLFERKLGHTLNNAEHADLVLRLRTVGPNRLGDIALDMDGAQLADPHAR